MAALTLAAVALAIFVGSPRAQTGQGVYEACESRRAVIDAAVLPDVVDQDLCPIEGRAIVEDGVGALVPAPGESVFAEAMSPDGNQNLVVSNPRGDRLVVEEVGIEAAARESDSLSTRAGSPSACRDRHYNNWDSRLNHYIRWYFNGRTTPSVMSKSAVLRAMQRGGKNISGVQDACGVADHVPAVLRYVGWTTRSVNMGTDGVCGANDHKSVVGFGDLPGHLVGNTCVWSWIQDGPNRINSSDVRLNKADYYWTARVTNACRGRQDVESTMTHERGHTFGLGDVSDSDHARLTMSSRSNGPCQTSERSLGRGDAIGLNRKY